MLRQNMIDYVDDSFVYPRLQAPGVLAHVYFHNRALRM